MLDQNGPASHRLIDRVRIPRRRGHLDPIRFGSGVDFGSDGFSLIELRDRSGHPTKILAWFRGHETPACGIRGFGHVYVPAHLAIIWEHGFESVQLMAGGRLSIARILEHAAQIDRHFGHGASALIEIRRTLVIT